jgi:hypothetical protein
MQMAQIIFLLADSKVEDNLYAVYNSLRRRARLPQRIILALLRCITHT